MASDEVAFDINVLLLLYASKHNYTGILQEILLSAADNTFILVLKPQVP